MDGVSSMVLNDIFRDPDAFTKLQINMACPYVTKACMYVVKNEGYSGSGHIQNKYHVVHEA